jgi:acyl carrier protein
MHTDKNDSLPGEGIGDMESSTEERIAQIWLEILGSSHIDYNQSFFELSGRSVDAIRLVNRLSSVFGTEVTVRTVFEAPTVVKLAKVIETAPRSLLPRLQAGAADSS